MLTLYTDYLNNRKMNPFSMLIKFLSGQPGALRFGSLSHTQDLHYETIADGKRNMREDLARLGHDWKKITKEVSRDGKKN